MSCEQTFELHPQLAADSVLVCELALCQVRMIVDANYPWFILVPKQNGLSEPHHLSREQQLVLSQESRLLSLAIEHCFRPAKLNIASIGNMVPMLHVHHIARFKDDIAWPKPVWGFTSMKAYEHQQQIYRINAMGTEIAKQRSLVS